MSERIYIILCMKSMDEMDFELTPAMNNSIDAIIVTVEMKRWTLINSLPLMDLPISFFVFFFWRNIFMFICDFSVVCYLVWFPPVLVWHF